MKILAAMAVIAAFLTLSASALADPKSAEKGCHGYYTTKFKTQLNDRGAQGTAIGGRGNSDDDAANGQAHSQAGRRAWLQQLLATYCDVGSEAPPSSSSQPSQNNGDATGGPSQGEHGQSQGEHGRSSHSSP